MSSYQVIISVLCNSLCLYLEIVDLKGHLYKTSVLNNSDFSSVCNWAELHIPLSSKHVANMASYPTPIELHRE